jgi:glutamyl-tRNA synthetase
MKPAGSRRAALSWICDSCKARQRAQPSPLTSTSRCRYASNATPGKLPSTPARTRFAPSPTGSLHLGSIRTAAFNYLLAKRTKGKFLLRIEDTDQKRTVPGAEQQIYDDLSWAGLQWDEGPIVSGPHEPYRQSERNQIYHKQIDRLLETGHAYRCFCSPERLDELNRRRHEKGLGLGYDRKCSDIQPAESAERAYNGEPHTVRFRSPQIWPTYKDLVYGKTGHGQERAKKLLINEPVWEDAILMKSDGFPTYHWANVCDDFEMQITHVIRGSEWMSSTPLHMALYQSMGWPAPLYAHVPLLVDLDGQKLSKRNFNTNLSSYRETGILPEALVNFATLLGWSHQQKNDVMDLKELEARFDLKITKGNTIVSFNKLRFLQDQHAKRRMRTGKGVEELIQSVSSALLKKYGRAQVEVLLGNRTLLNLVRSMLKNDTWRYYTADEFAEQCSIFFSENFKRPSLTTGNRSILKRLRISAATLTLVPEEIWDEATHSANLALLMQQDVEDAGLSEKEWKKELHHYLRWALLGGLPGPSIVSCMEILGRKICVERLQSATLELNDLETMETKLEVTVDRHGFSSTPIDSI